MDFLKLFHLVSSQKDPIAPITKTKYFGFFGSFFTFLRKILL